jgi:hypothetical protein
MSEIAQLKQSPIFSATKAESIGMVNSYLEDLAFNGGDPLKDLVLCRKYIFLLEEIEKGLKGFAMSELEKFDNNETELLSSTLKAVETGIKFDFTASSAWVAQKEAVDKATAKLKEIEAFAKACKEKTTVVDSETGEALDYFPPSKSSSTSIRFTYK